MSEIVFFKNALGEIYDLTISPNDSIREIKSMIGNVMNVIPERLILYYKTYKLNDKQAIKSLDISPDEAISVRVCQEGRQFHFDQIEHNIKDSQISQIMELGFTKKEAIDALDRYDGEIESAVSYLMNINHSSPNSQSPSPSNDSVVRPKSNITVDDETFIYELMDLSGFDYDQLVQMYLANNKDKDKTTNALIGMLPSS